LRLVDAKRDQYRRLAKKEGYRSRSAYKLLQLDKTYHILRPGYVVVDFGSAPGGWLQVTSEKIGRNGLVIGIDIDPIKPISENIHILVGDVLAPETKDELLKLLPRKADVILSDLAPDVTGVWQIDHLRQIDLASKVVDLMPDLLRRGGAAVMKVFEGEETNRFHHQVRGVFEKVFTAKPPASRGQASEMYLVALGYRPPS